VISIGPELGDEALRGDVDIERRVFVGHILPDLRDNGLLGGVEGRGIAVHVEAIVEVAEVALGQGRATGDEVGVHPAALEVQVKRVVGARVAVQDRQMSVEAATDDGRVVDDDFALRNYIRGVECWRGQGRREKGRRRRNGWRLEDGRRHGVETEGQQLPFLQPLDRKPDSPVGAANACVPGGAQFFLEPLHGTFLCCLGQPLADGSEHGGTNFFPAEHRCVRLLWMFLVLKKWPGVTE
jgi:hypothetical protein